ncbi:MAG: S8 family serine peptidase [Desulfobacteraceae bacterium]|nr:S8 family serine peptidase [Desulfobacteraceae bacterium]
MKRVLLSVISVVFMLSVVTSVFAIDVQSKIDPEIYEKFSQEQVKVKTLLKDVVTDNPVRVIIHLESEESSSVQPLLLMNTLNDIPTLGQKVKKVQDKFIESLGSLSKLKSFSSSSTISDNGFSLLMKMDYQYAVVANVMNVNAVETIAKRSDVSFIELDHLNELFTVEGRNLVGSDLAESSGFTGDGIGVAVIDSSFDLLHSELGGSVTLPNGVISAGENFSDPGTSIHSQNNDDCYHGTGTISIVHRYAPDASLYGLTVFPNAYDSVIAQAINWCVTNKDGANGGAPIKIISMSLGGSRYYSECNSGLLHTAAGNAVSNGIVVFAASGNDGWIDSMGSPACSSNVISVGSVWDENDANYEAFYPAYCSDSNRLVNERTCYSDTASFLDIYAPSEEVMCANCGGGTRALGGTSSACPAAAGMTAQLLQALPEYTGQKDELLALYNNTGVQVIGDTTKNRIDLSTAIGIDIPPITSQLEKGVAQTFSLQEDAIKEFTIVIPSNVTNLEVTITGSGDIDLYVKNSAIDWPSEKGSHDTDTFKAPYESGSSESVLFSSPGEGTWNVLLHGYSAGDGTIIATWETDDGVWTYESFIKSTTHNYGNNKTYEFEYMKTDAQQVGVHFNTLNTESGYDFLYVYDENDNQVYKVSGNLITDGTGSAFDRSDGWVIIPGNKIRIKLITDYSITRYGYEVDQSGFFK